MRAEPHPNPRRPNDARGASHRPRPSHRSALVETGTPPPLHRRVERRAWQCARRVRSGSREADRMGGASAVALATLVRAAGVDRAGRLRAARWREDPAAVQPAVPSSAHPPRIRDVLRDVSLPLLAKQNSCFIPTSCECCSFRSSPPTALITVASFRTRPYTPRTVLPPANISAQPNRTPRARPV